MPVNGSFAPQAASRKSMSQRSDGANATSDLQRPARSGRSRRPAMRRAGNACLSAASHGKVVEVSTRSPMQK